MKDEIPPALSRRCAVAPNMRPSHHLQTRAYMKVLVTGGTGVIGDSTVRALHQRGHAIRVLTRHAGRDEAWWPEGVEGWAGDVSNHESIQGAAEGCDAVLHIAGIA